MQVPFIHCTVSPFKTIVFVYTFVFLSITSDWDVVQLRFLFYVLPWCCRTFLVRKLWSYDVHKIFCELLKSSITLKNSWKRRNFIHFLVSEQRATPCFWGCFWNSTGRRKFSKHYFAMMWVSKMFYKSRGTRRTKNQSHTTSQSKVMDENKKV